MLRLFNSAMRWGPTGTEASLHPPVNWLLPTPADLQMPLAFLMVMPSAGSQLLHTQGTRDFLRDLGLPCWLLGLLLPPALACDMVADVTANCSGVGRGDCVGGGH